MKKETKEEYFTRRLHELIIGEQEIFTLVIMSVVVTRVPGGWLMGYSTQGLADNNDVFVPISSEGAPSAIKQLEKKEL